MRLAVLSPPVRRLLVHMRDTGGWLLGDWPSHQSGAVLAAERRGLVMVQRRADGRVLSATLTATGREESRTLP